MRRVRFLAMAALCLAVQPGLISQPALSQDLGSLISGLTGMGDIDARQTYLERRIKDAISAGRLTFSEGDVYLKQLGQIEQNEASYRVSDNKLNTWEIMRLSYDLDKLSRDLESHMHDRKSGTGDIGAVQSDILHRMSEGFSSKRLTQQEFDDLKYDFDRAASLEAMYRRNDGKLDYDESLKVALELDRLSSKLERTLHERTVTIPEADLRQAELEKKIAEGVAAGKLTGSETEQLRTEFNRIAEKETILKSSSHIISAEDKLALLIDLERLNTQIELKLNNSDTAGGAPTTQIDLRKKNTEHLIASSLVAGKLSPLEAQQFKSQLDRIQTLIRDMSQPDGVLNATEQQTIAVEYSMLESRINRTMFERNDAWVGVTGRLSQLEARISDALSTHRLTDSEGATLRAELQRIKEISVSGRRTDGSYPLDTSLLLSADLERLDKRVDQTLHDRSEVSVDLDQKKIALDHMISEGVFAGTLTLAEAKELDNEADRIQRRETEMRNSNGLNYREKLALAYDLERLATQVDVQNRNNEKDPTSLTQQKALVDKEIASSTLSGRLTDDEARAAKSEKDRLNMLELQCRSSDGRLTAGESILIVSEWDKLKKQVKRQSQDRERDLTQIDERQLQIHRRIAEGRSSGRITANEADRLTAEYERIAREESKYRADGGLSYGEHLALGVELEQLSRQVEKLIANNKVNLADVDTRQREIDIQLANAVGNGRLVLKDAQAFRNEIDRIANLEASYRQSGGGLSVAESQMLLTDLEKLQNTVDLRLKDQKPVWSGITARRNEISTQVNTLDASHKLKPEDVQRFKSELSRIAQAEAAFQASGGVIDFSETVSLVSDLDLLKRRIDRSSGVSTVNIAWDDIDARQAQLERRINTAIVRRQVNPIEGKRLKQEFSKINQAESLFKANDGSLSYFEKMALAGQIDKLIRSMPKTIQE